MAYGGTFTLHVLLAAVSFWFSSRIVYKPRSTLEFCFLFLFLRENTYSKPQEGSGNARVWGLNQMPQLSRNDGLG